MKHYSVDESIMGPSLVTPDHMSAFVKKQNPDALNIDEIAVAFIEVGEKYGVRGDVAFCQSIIETGWFTFAGSAVTPDQYNFCGMGVTSNGMKGNSFASVREGVTAQIQHLYGYATMASLPEGEELVDPRFKYVARGVAPSWIDLNMRWAMNNAYGQSILTRYDSLLAFSSTLNIDEPSGEDEQNEITPSPFQPPAEDIRLPTENPTEDEIPRYDLPENEIEPIFQDHPEVDPEYQDKEQQQEKEDNGFLGFLKNLWNKFIGLFK